MSALGQKQTLQSVRPMSALPLKADIRRYGRHVRFAPTADIGPCVIQFSRLPRKANARNQSGRGDGRVASCGSGQSLRMARLSSNGMSEAISAKIKSGRGT